MGWVQEGGSGSLGFFWEKRKSYHVKSVKMSHHSVSCEVQLWMQKDELQNHGIIELLLENHGIIELWNHSISWIGITESWNHRISWFGIIELWNLRISWIEIVEFSAITAPLQWSCPDYNHVEIRCWQLSFVQGNCCSRGARSWAAQCIPRFWKL